MAHLKIERDNVDMTKFSKEIMDVFSCRQDGLNNNSSNLPLVHSTSSLKALKILEQGTLSAKIDNKVKEDEAHLYSFYGRAAYPVQKGELPRGDYSYFTFCFLLKAESKIISYAFPFDSGAFINGLYSPFFNKDFDLLQFLLPSDLIYINNFVRHVFGNNHNYVCGNITTKTRNISYDTSFEVSAYCNMITNKSAQKVDSRCRTIEIISTSDLELNRDTLLAIVMPEILRDKKVIKNFLDNFPSLDVISYPCFFGDTDDSYYGVVREKVYTYLLERGLITN